MEKMPIYQALAEAFAMESVDTHFTLMGDGNMHWATAMSNIEGMKTVHARHEHCACAMAMGYQSATGKVGVASVTCGPGFTQVMTALAQASRSDVPLVVFAGEAPLGVKWYNQQIEQSALAVPTGAHYISAHTPQRMYQYVRDAFYIARHERRPVVLGVPYDLQKQDMPDVGPYQRSIDLIPNVSGRAPTAAEIDLVVERLANANCPIVLAGRGAMWAEAEPEIEELARRSGALLATTLLARGMFDHDPFSIGIAGGYARETAREVAAECDLLISFGASMSYYTIDGGLMFPKAKVVQVNTKLAGLHEGGRVADIYIQADAKIAAKLFSDKIASIEVMRANVRAPELARRLRSVPADSTHYDIETGLVDPREAIAKLDGIIPKSFDILNGSGHQAYFPTVLRDRSPRKYHDFKGFGAVGSGFSWAIGVAAARENGQVLLFEGDGSFLMHIQEMETVRRYGMKFLVCILNDGAYGAEIHKLRGEGIDESGAIFGRPDFAAIAKGFGWSGATVTSVEQFDGLFRNYMTHDKPEIWDIHVSDQVVNPRMRKLVKAKNSLT